MLRRISTTVMVVLLVLMTINVQAQEMMECSAAKARLCQSSLRGRVKRRNLQGRAAPVLEARDITLNYEGSRDMNTILPTRGGWRAA
jgi:hypothetical protein